MQSSLSQSEGLPMSSPSGGASPQSALMMGLNHSGGGRLLKRMRSPPVPQHSMSIISDPELEGEECAQRAKRHMSQFMASELSGLLGNSQHVGSPPSRNRATSINSPASPDKFPLGRINYVAARGMLEASQAADGHEADANVQDYLMNAESPQLSSADQNRSDDSVGLPRTTSLHIMLSPVLPGAPSPPLAAGQRPPSQPLPMLPIPLPSILEYSKAGYNTAGCAGMPNPNLNSTPIASAAATLPSLSAAAGYCAGVSSAAPPPVRPAVVARRSGSDTLLRSLGLAVPAGATGVGSGGMQGGSGGLQGVPNRPNGPNGRSGASPRYPLPLPQDSLMPPSPSDARFTFADLRKTALLRSLTQRAQGEANAMTDDADEHTSSPALPADAAFTPPHGGRMQSSRLQQGSSSAADFRQQDGGLAGTPLCPMQQQQDTGAAHAANRHLLPPRHHQGMGSLAGRCMPVPEQSIMLHFQPGQAPDSCQGNVPEAAYHPLGDVAMGAMATSPQPRPRYSCGGMNSQGSWGQGTSNFRGMQGSSPMAATRSGEFDSALNGMSDDDSSSSSAGMEDASRIRAQPVTLTPAGIIGFVGPAFISSRQVAGLQKVHQPGQQGQHPLQLVDMGVSQGQMQPGSISVAVDLGPVPHVNDMLCSPCGIMQHQGMGEGVAAPIVPGSSYLEGTIARMSTSGVLHAGMQNIE